MMIKEKRVVFNVDYFFNIARLKKLKITDITEITDVICNFQKLFINSFYHCLSFECLHRLKNQHALSNTRARVHTHKHTLARAYTPIPPTHATPFGFPCLFIFNRLTCDSKRKKKSPKKIRCAHCCRSLCPLFLLSLPQFSSLFLHLQPQ